MLMRSQVSMHVETIVLLSHKSPDSCLGYQPLALFDAFRKSSHEVRHPTLVIRQRSFIRNREMSPLASAVFACSAAVFKVVSFSMVSDIASERSFCFCARNSVLPGSSFSSFSTSFRCAWVFLISELTPFRAVCNFVVAPPISTVIPLILLAAIVHLLSENGYKNCPALLPSIKKAPI